MVASSVVDLTIGSAAGAICSADAEAAEAVGRAGSVAAPAELHLVSWNVAGWKTTVENLRRFEGGLSAFLSRHHVDILCLQEVKLTAKAIAADSVKLGADVPGYESFWACNEGNGTQRQGLNGVGTMAREGTVLRADSAPLGDPELDAEGRCLLTDHGHFVVFNVYVPNAAGGPRLPFKLRWLRALRAAMGRARAAGKAVVLAGDLNMKSRPADCHWTFRYLNIPKLDEMCSRSDHLGPDARDLAHAASKEWPRIATALRGKEVVPIETRNTRNGQIYQRWAIVARAPSGEMVRLGPPAETEGHARASLIVNGSAVEFDGTVRYGPDASEDAYVLQQPDTLCAGDLAECLKRLAGVEAGAATVRALSEAFGQATTAPAVAAWLEGVLREDGMVDTFAELYPDAEERFTCWDQYKNRRHENVGSRIDYILADRSLFAQHARRGLGLDARSGAAGSPNSAAAALSAATLGGLSEPSPFAGGGMPPLEEDEYLAQFREGPATGIVYTPPQLSDHVAVSLLLSGLSLTPAGSSAVARTRDSVTRRCQPHRSAKRITDFFSAQGRPAASHAEAAPAAKRHAP